MIFEMMHNEMLRVCELDVEQIPAYDDDEIPELLNRLFLDQLPLSLCATSIYRNLIARHPYFSQGNRTGIIRKISVVKANGTTAAMVNGKVVSIYYDNTTYHYPVFDGVPALPSPHGQSFSTLASCTANAVTASATGAVSNSP